MLSSAPGEGRGRCPFRPDYTPGVPLTVISLTFDPVLLVSETASVRIETIALGLVLFVALPLLVRSSAAGSGTSSITSTTTARIPPRWRIRRKAR